ncbi:hypothetical protein [Aliikangiella sp. IMCC44632]
MMTKNYIAVVLFCISFLCKSADYKCVDRDFSAEQSEKTIKVRLIETNGKLDIFLPKQKDISTLRYMLFEDFPSYSVDGEMYTAHFFKDNDIEIFEEMAYKKFGVNSINKLIENAKNYDCRELQLFFREKFGRGVTKEASQKAYIFNNMLIQYSKKHGYFYLLIPSGEELYHVNLQMNSSSAFKDMYDFFAIEP